MYVTCVLNLRNKVIYLAPRAPQKFKEGSHQKKYPIKKSGSMSLVSVKALGLDRCDLDETLHAIMYTHSGCDVHKHFIFFKDF